MFRPMEQACIARETHDGARPDGPISGHVRELDFRPGQHALPRRQRHLRPDRSAHDRLCRSAFLKLPREAACARCRKSSIASYGTTLNGLMREHGVDAGRLSRTMSMTSIWSTWRRMPALTAAHGAAARAGALSSPMAAADHAARILERLGLTAIVRRDRGTSAPWAFMPKPELQAYAQRGGAAGIEPRPRRRCSTTSPAIWCRPGPWA